jgi:predicted MFS family arabinose efflux permease
MFRLPGSYKNVEKHIVNVVIAEAFLQIVNSSFLIALLIYMDKQGYSDHESTAYFKYRFLGVLLFAYPLGLYIKGRKIKPLFYISCIAFPALSLLIVYAIHHHMTVLIYASQIAWGTAFMLFQVSVLPYIMRNARKDTQTQAISLSFSTWSFSTIIAGLLIFGLQMINPKIFTEEFLLSMFCVLSFGALFFIWKVDVKENLNRAPKGKPKEKYDWWLISKALVPTVLIAVGAGLTIPFISLFFYNVHGFDTDSVSLVFSGATVIVLIAILAVPTIKEKIGFARAIPGTQMLAVLMLVGLATTEWYASLPVAGVIAVIFYMLRQPLMNIAGPMTSELTMNYVGQNNQELMSALNASIWSGSWFFSGWAFQILREEAIPYGVVFLITAAFYAVGVATYILLIKDYRKREKAGLIC